MRGGGVGGMRGIDGRRGAAGEAASGRAGGWGEGAKVWGVRVGGCKAGAVRVCGGPGCAAAPRAGEGGAGRRGTVDFVDGDDERFAVEERLDGGKEGNLLGDREAALL